MPYTHFAEISDIVEIKKSKIRGAGDGLFAKTNIEKGEFICWYFGCLVEKDVVENGYYDSDYLLQNPLKPNLIIDASDPLSCYGRYANDSLSLKKNNSEFDYYSDVNSGSLKATKKIAKGNEIYVSYGKEYWEEPRRYSKLSKRNQKEIKEEF
jgi:hypothetical protein